MWKDKNVKAYGAYGGIYIDELESRENAVLLEAAYWAHCRRCFYNARTGDPLHSHIMLAHIQRLYVG